MEILTKYTRFSLTAFGAWPGQKNEKLCKGLFIICFLCVIFCLFLPQTIKMLQVWNNFDLLSNILCTAELTFFIAITKMVVLFVSKNSRYILKIEYIQKKRN